MDNNTVRDLFYNHNGRLVHKWDHYFEIYEKYFSAYKDKKVAILEIGISHGGSLQLWKNYFGNQLMIYAIDINPQCKQFEEENVKVFIGSQSDPGFLDEVCRQLPDLDIVIDDGGHSMPQQITSFEHLYMKLKEGGLYIVEDTHTSYWHEFHGGLKNPKSFIEYSKNMIDSLYDSYVHEKKRLRIDELTKHIYSIAFYDSIVVFEKKMREPPFHLRNGSETIESYMPVDLKKKTLMMRLKRLLFGKVNTFRAHDRGKL